MNQIQIDKLNEQIPYNDGKIKWEMNKGYTSETMKYLYKCGYEATKSGCSHHLKDNKGNLIASGDSWTGLLLNTALIMA